MANDDYQVTSTEEVHKALNQNPQTFEERLDAVYEAFVALFTKGHRSKTVAFGALLIIFTNLQYFLPDLAFFFGKHHQAVMNVVGGLVIFLRVLTFKSLAGK